MFRQTKRKKNSGTDRRKRFLRIEALDSRCMLSGIVDVYTVGGIPGGPATVTPGDLYVIGDSNTHEIEETETTATVVTLTSGDGTLFQVNTNSGPSTPSVTLPNITGNILLSGGVPDDPAGFGLALGVPTFFELDAVSSGNEILMPSGQLILSDQQFSDFAFATQPGFGSGTYTLVEAGSISGSLAANASGAVGGYPATLAVQGDNLVLDVAPEPSAMALLAAGAIGLLGDGWRRHRTVRKTAKRTALDRQDDGPAILSFPSHVSCPAHAARAARRSA